MSKPKSPTPLQKWIICRIESAQETANFLDNNGVSVERETVRRWMKGERKPSRELLGQLSTATGLSVGDLIK